MTQSNIRYPIIALLLALIILASVVYWLASRPATAEPSAARPANDTTASAPPPATARPAGPPQSAADWATLLAQLLSLDAAAQQSAVDWLVDAGDPQAIPVLIEMLRAAQLQLVLGSPRDYGMALNTLTGETFGSDWAGWVEWYGATDLQPPPGFTAWKGQMLSRIDPGFAEFLYAGAPSALRPEEIQWGGVTVDGIPALDNPAMLPASAAGYLQPDEPVFGLEINGEARAYPLRIMDWHEMANDVVGGVPVSIAYCTLCGAAIAYDGRASDGRTYDFGSSGFLYRSNKLMYDRQTRTLWNQLTGKPVLGQLVEEAVTLDILPIVLTSWSDWQSRHPDTLVLDPETGFNRDYRLGAAYGDYFSGTETMFPVWQRADLLETKDQIYALTIAGIPKAYPLDRLTDEQVVNDTIGQTPVVLIAARGIIEADGEHYRSGPVRYQAGGEVRAYERGDHTFSPGPQPDLVLDESAVAWEVREDGLHSPAGEILPRLGGHLAYWFGWYAFFPQTLVYGQ